MLHVIKDGVVSDDKYIVFRRDEWMDWFTERVGFPPQTIADAVVIRTQDVFAGPALHGYAASIGVAIQILRDTRSAVNLAIADDMQNIADYFSQRATEADEGPRKIPD